MIYGHNLFQTVNFPHNNHERQYHRKSGKDCTGNEVGWKNGCVPSRNQGYGKVKRYNCVYGEYKGSGQSGKNHVRLLIVPPVAVTTSPAQGKCSVENFSDFTFYSVSYRSKIWNQTYVPEEK